MKKLLFGARLLKETGRKFCSTADEGLYENVQGVNLNYCRHGIGKHNVLCLPGALGSWRTDFGPQLSGPNALDEKAFTVIAWDPPGYGRSRPPDRDFSRGFFERDAYLAHGLMFKLNLIPYSVIGWSDGGITALFLAYQLCSTKSTFRQKLNLIPYSVIGWSDGGITALFLAYQLCSTNLVRKMVIFGANAYVTKQDVEKYEEINDVQKWSEKMRGPMIEMYGEEYFRKTWEDEVKAFREFYDKDNGDICRKLLHDIKFETLIIHGEKDAMIGVEHQEFLRNNLMYSWPILYHPEGKHNLHLRYPDWFKREVEEFLKHPPFRPKL